MQKFCCENSQITNDLKTDGGSNELVDFLSSHRNWFKLASKTDSIDYDIHHVITSSSSAERRNEHSKTKTNEPNYVTTKPNCIVKENPHKIQNREFPRVISSLFHSLHDFVFQVIFLSLKE